MPKNAKGKSKGGAGGYLGVQPASTKSRSKAGQAPAPFVFPDEKVKPFLEWLDPKHIYITHIDDHPTNFKLQLFCVPVFMNAVLISLLFVRAYSIAPYYWQLLLTLWGHHTPYWIDIKNTGWNIVMDQIVRRTMTFMLDLFLVRFVGQWPYDFFFARPASPCAWRWSIGFRQQEIAVRRSRPWDAKLPRGWWKAEASDDGGAFRDRIMPAIERRWVLQKSAYMMLDKNWDLDFHCMIQAEALVEHGILTLADLRKQVWVYTEDHGWLVWPVWKLDDPSGGSGDTTAATATNDSGKNHKDKDPEKDPGRQKILAFKEKLTAMDKEDLFYRWIEIVQYESSQPGGFTEERQARAMRDARQLFEEQGVNFDRFWDEVGGREGLPGLDDQ